MVRIRIVGGPGSGKTYLAQQLSKKLSIPHYDLDNLYWSQTTYGVAADEKQRDKKLQSILKKKNWIIEGAFTGGWTLPTEKAADKIVILETPRLTRMYRIKKRFLLRKLGFQKTKKESLKDLYGLLKWNWNYDRKTLTRVDREKHKKKIIICRSKRDLKNLRFA